MKVGISTKLIIANLIFAGIVLFTTLLTTIYYWPQNNVNKNVKLTIKKGESLAIISNNLMNKGIITNNNMFELIAKIRGLDTSIPIGTFNLKNLNVNKDIIDHLAFGIPERRKITLLEGWNSKQIAKYLSNEMGLDYNNIINTINDKGFINSLKINKFFQPKSIFFSKLFNR